MTKYEPHPTNLAFRYLTGDSWKRLLASVKEHGQRADNPIVLGRGTRSGVKVILDGKNLEKACLELGLVPRYEDYKGPPIEYSRFIILRNLHRRHDNESQRAITARRLALLEVGRPRKSGPNAGLSQSEAGHIFNVGDRTIRKAGEVLRRGVPELVQAVEAGELDVTPAAEIARLPKREQREKVRAAAAGVDVVAEVRAENRLSVALRLADSELAGLQALAELGAAARDPRARAGVVVLRKLVPALGVK